MDALSDVLRVAHLTGGVFLHADFTAPWCISARPSAEVCSPFFKSTTNLIPYHYVVDGEFYLALGDGEPLLFRRGDIVLLPHNDLHLMGSDLNLPPIQMVKITHQSESGGLRFAIHGGSGAKTRVICGYLGYDGTHANPVLAMLPATIKLKVDDAGPAEWIRSTFQFAADELAAGRPGSETVLAKLSELLFVEAVRRYIESLPAGQSGWLAGLQDPVVSRALALMHNDIARPWSVDELGRAAGLSRSALAERFTRVIGMSPIHYLAHWRMQVAAQTLKGTNDSLARIAETVGYESEAAFSRAFKKAFGSAPATWRRAEP